jgi:hydrophobe/amphiphile efflux-1 (HAE1) family protein
VAYDASVYVEKAIHEVWQTLGMAFFLVVLIIFVFLRNVRSTIIPSVAIPVSIVGTFAILYAFGYSVNILTMLALVLTIGIVVDDAIVVLEAIYRHIEEGMPPMKAAFKAMEEISFAVIAITISLVAVFAPLAFQRSTTGRLFIEFAVAVAGSVIISAFVALTLSPAMSGRILKSLEGVKHGPLFNFFERGFDWFSTTYSRGLRWSLRHRVLMVIVTLGTLVVMVLAYLGLEQDFLPLEDKSRMFCIVLTPNGSTSEFTDRQLQKAERIVAAIPEVQTFGAVVAPAFAGPGQANFGVIFVRFKDHSQRKRSVQEIVHGPGGVQERFFAEVEGALAIPNLPKAIEISFRDSPFELILQNQDLDELNKRAQAIANKIRAMNNLRYVRVGFEVDKPELRVSIDRSRAAALGVSIEDISRTMQILFGGLDLSRIKVHGKEYYVMAQLARQSRLTPQELDKIFVRNNKSELIQLSSLVSYTQGAAPNSINHYGRLRSASITASTGVVPIGTVVKEVEAMLAHELPAGTLYAWGGDAKSLRDAGTEIWWVLILAMIIVYMTLAAQFESLVHPLTVMLALPLAAIGAFGLLWLLNFGGKIGLYPPIPAMNINLFSQIGLVLLVGLVTKNSILLVEFANQQRAKGLGSHEAMIEAGRVRLRPILMTAFSTIAGILPIAIGFGAGAESRRPMGVAVAGGMLTSTFLTLVIIPVIYTLFSDLGALVPRILRKEARPVPELEPVAK